MPTKILIGTQDIVCDHLSNIYNNSKNDHKHPKRLKLADVTPIHKKGETTLLLSTSKLYHCSTKLFERDMYNQILIKHLLFVQYRGKCTEGYARALHRAKAPCTVVMTLRKLKTVLPLLKTPVEKALKSGVVYKLSCPRCRSCYVGQTIRHLQTRFKEHLKPSAAVSKHLKICKTTISCKETEILAATQRGQALLMTLESIWIRDLAPSINTKEEYKSRELTIRW